jgi:phosphate starvation-inducible PhoH-like protein
MRKKIKNQLLEQTEQKLKNEGTLVDKPYKNIDKSPIIDKSPLVPQRPKLKQNLNIFNRSDFTTKQKEFIDLTLNKDVKMIFVSGPAGTTKTFLSVYSALQLMNQKKISDIVYVRSVIESADKSIGALPGTIDEKYSVYVQPLLDKLEELLQKNEIDLLQKEQRISGVPINFLRGLNWNAKAIIADEAQNLNAKEMTTLITRIGQFSKLYITGDPEQSDINGKSAFNKFINIFDDAESRENGIYVFRFTEEDILRSKLVKFIVKKLRTVN